MTTHEEKGRAFAELHRGPTFVIPNPWDPGTTRVLEGFGFPALATTSAGFAFAAGVRDGTSSRESVLLHVELIAASTDLPVSADLEDGYGDAPETVAETIALVAEHGAVGASIEDRAYRGDKPGLHSRGLSIDRITAAAEAARGLPFPFTVTARCENFIVGNPDLGETIRRLQAYQEAGADVLYAPWRSDAGELSAICRSVDRPVNAVMGLAGAPLSVADLAAIGITRISLGSTLARTAFGALLDAARELAERGGFSFAKAAVPYSTLDDMFPSAASTQ